MSICDVSVRMDQFSFHSSDISMSLTTYFYSIKIHYERRKAHVEEGLLNQKVLGARGVSQSP